MIGLRSTKTKAITGVCATSSRKLKRGLFFDISSVKVNNYLKYDGMWLEAKTSNAQ